MGYSIEGTQHDCYPDTTILINKLNIKNQQELNNVEKQLVLLNASIIEKSTDFNNVDFSFYKSLHKQLFGDLYDWAGTLRSLNISKKGTVFCDVEQLEKIGNIKFKKLAEMNYFRDLSRSDFVYQLTEFYNDMNMLHPFREGNGRTLRLFITLLIRNAGYSISFAECDADLLMIATIRASQGDTQMLYDIFSNLMK